MGADFFSLMKYAATGQASSEMTHYDKMRALSMAGGKIETLTGIPPISFTGNGKPLISWSMKGNGQQTGTPSPDNIIMPTFCGKLVGADWTIPITCAGQTTPVYLGQTQTVRRVKKLVLTGEENWVQSGAAGNTFYFTVPGYLRQRINITICSHYTSLANINGAAEMQNGKVSFYANAGQTGQYFYVRDSNFTTIDALKSYLAAQYAAGHPVTVWYVLAEPETAIVNEPLCKIGDYADELHSEDAGVTIPTVRGQNTLTVDTELQPSEMTITGHIKRMQFVYVTDSDGVYCFDSDGVQIIEEV